MDNAYLKSSSGVSHCLATGLVSHIKLLVPFRTSEYLPTKVCRRRDTGMDDNVTSHFYVLLAVPLLSCLWQYEDELQANFNLCYQTSGSRSP